MPYCAKCGAAISEGARFCPACGTPVGLPERVPYEIREKREKEEKHEKREKGEKHEKEKTEKREGDRLGAFVGGATIILLGILLYLVQIGTFSWITWSNWWGYFLLGLGCILIVSAVLRAAVATYRGAAVGPLIGGVILCFVGLSGIINIESWWPLILIAVGITIIVGGLVAVSRSPKPR